MTTKSSNIFIHWHMQEPSLAAQSWRIWRTEEFPTHLSSPMNELRLSPLCQEILKTALSERLSRRTGFECADGSDKAFCRAVEQAAAVFKRGVAFRPHRQAQVTQQVRSGSYPITLIERLDLLSTGEPAEDIFYIFDQNVYHHWCSGKSYKHSLVLQLDEQSKTLDSVHQILNAWQTHSLSKWMIVGGGVLADTAMFAASLVQAEVVLCPTTLLAMVDACIGGKTGVNVPGLGKNLIGSFYFPRQVVVYSEFLKTLPEREWYAGLAECLKHAFIAQDIELAQVLAAAGRNQDFTSLEKMLPKLINIKAQIVERDPNETGERAILNLGHTLGHALEGYAHRQNHRGGDLLHGEGVAFGLVFTLLLSNYLQTLSSSKMSLMLQALQDSNLKLSSAFLSKALGGVALNQDLFTDLLELMRQDKKRSHRQNNNLWDFVLLDNNRTRHSGWLTSVSENDLREVWVKYLAVLS